MNEFFLFFLLFFSVEAVNSQSVSNIETTQTNDIIDILYTVSGISKNQPYSVSIFYTTDNLNFSEPIQSVKGDVGNGVKGNGKKKISWDVLKDVNSFDGNYAFKIELILDDEISLPTASSGKFSTQINRIKLSGNTLVFDMAMVNLNEDGKYEIRVKDTRIIGSDGNEYFSVNASTNSSSEKYSLEMNLIKDIPMKFQLTFDNIPNNLYDISFFEIESKSSPQPNISFKNLKIEH